MIWTTLALFVVSFLLTALLAPRPDVEDARAEEFNPDSFPRATEDDPVPLVLGRVRMRSPNTLWYGNFRNTPNTELVKTGIFPWQKKRVTVGYFYYLTMDMGLCLGPNVCLHTIYIDDVAVWGPGESCYEVVSFPLEAEVESGDSTPPVRYIDLLDFASQEEIDAGQVSIALSVTHSSEYFGLGGSGPAPQQVIVSLSMVNDSLAVVENYGSDSNNDDGGGTATIGGVSVPGTRYAAYTAKVVRTFPLFSTSVIEDKTLVVSTLRRRSVSFCDVITEPDLFGGLDEGGGWVGQFCFYNGNFDQDVDTYLTSADILGPDGTPAYRGMSHIVFQDNAIGESPQLRRMSFEISAYTNNLGRFFDGRITSSGLDINPAEALYEILHSDWRGLSVDPSKIDIASFRSVAATLQSEVNGCSLQVTRSQDGRTVITEILRQIDGVLYEEPTTGQMKLRLIRDDYDESTLPVYDEDDIIEVTNFTKTSWEDVYSQVKVSFASRESESSLVAVAQDMAVANMMGKLRTASVSFPFCYDKNLANKLAARELSRLSVPIFRCTLEMNRRAYNIRPGDVFKLTWPEYGITEAIVRVQKYDLGELLNNRIILEVVQDLFAATDVVFAPPEDSGWVSDRPTPTDVLQSLSPEMPYFLSQQTLYPVQEGYTDIIVMPRRPQTVSVGYTINSGLISSDLPIRDPDRAPYPVSFFVQNAYSITAGFSTGLDATGIDIYQVVGDLETFTGGQNRNGEGLIYVGDEWMTYEGVTDNGGGSYTLTNVRRAVLGTRPRAHAPNSLGFVFDYSILGDGILGGELEAGEEAVFKILDSVGPVTQSPSSVSPISYNTIGLRDRPLRPRNLRLDGVRDNVDVFPTNVDLSWVASRRRNDRVTFENDSAETPDLSETYRLEVWIDGVEDVSLAEASITTPFTIDFSSASGIIGEIRLWAVRSSDSAESADYAWLPFTLQTDLLLLSGDAQINPEDAELLSGDAQSGNDKLKIS